MIQSSPLLTHSIVRFDAAHRVRRPGHWLTVFTVVATMLASGVIIAAAGGAPGGATRTSRPLDHFPS